jgi:hypothetical protein
LNFEIQFYLISLKPHCYLIFPPATIMSSLREYLRIRLRERIEEANRLNENISKQNSFETGGVLQIQTPMHSVGSSVRTQSSDANISTTSSTNALKGNKFCLSGYGRDCLCSPDCPTNALKRKELCKSGHGGLLKLG